MENSVRNSVEGSSIHKEVRMCPRKAGFASNAKGKKCPWSAEEDHLLLQHVQTYGKGRWSALPERAGLVGRSPKSCRSRWQNYLRPGIKHGALSSEEKELIIRLHRLFGNRWSLIAGRVLGRTDNQIKNFWYTRMRKKHEVKVTDEFRTTTSVESPVDEVDCNVTSGDFEAFNICQEEDSFPYTWTGLDDNGILQVEPSYSGLLEIMEILQGNYKGG